EPTGEAPRTRKAVIVAERREQLDRPVRVLKGPVEPALFVGGSLKERLLDARSPLSPLVAEGACALDRLVEHLRRLDVVTHRREGFPERDEQRGSSRGIDRQERRGGTREQVRRGVPGVGIRGTTERRAESVVRVTCRCV